jgi:GMP synthase-like glutamine amidotransferase
MNPILVFRHVDCEGPGYLADFLNARGLPYRIVRVDEGESVPEDCADCAALVFMGGPMSVNDALPWITAELNLIRRAAATGVPILGHCLGGQLISRALGGSVGQNPVKEIGWAPVTRRADTPDGTWFSVIPETFEAFHWHGETFTLPAGAAPLLESSLCRQQAFARGNILALQFHCEMTAPLVREWCARYRHELVESPNQPGVQSETEMLAGIEHRIAALQGVATRLYTAWLDRWR